MAGVLGSRAFFTRAVNINNTLRRFDRSCCNYKGTVGFIGLGNMGGHMAKNLLKNNHKVVVCDMVPECVKDVQSAGASAAACPAEVAEQVDLIVTMLPSSPHVLTVYTGDGGIFSAVKPNTVMIDSSTIDPMVSRKMAAVAAEHDSVYMDAPVSGGVLAARDALLTFMVGGPAKEFQVAEQVLSHMGKNIVHCGDVGTGQAAKICNNMLLGISMIGTSECMNLGKRLGLDSKMLAKIVNMSSGRCWSSDTYNPCPGVLEGVPSSRDYQGGFGTALMAKDLGLAQGASTETKSPTPLGSAAHQIFRIMCQQGYSNLDFSSVYKFLQDSSKDE